MDEFIVRALVAAVGVAAVAGPLGCFVVWRRMSYFGATLSHAALLGVAFGIAFDLNPQIGVLGVAMLVSVLLVLLQRQQRLAQDTLLGILAHGALAIGLVALSQMETVRVDLLGYLFGDILAVRWRDIAWIYAGGGACLSVLAWIWRPLLLATLNDELARAEGVPVTRVQTIFMLLISVVVAVAMQIVGILLIVSLLIVPAAAARSFSATPGQMAVGAAVVGAVSAGGGLAMSVRWDTPTGPSIVVVAMVLFAVSFAFAGRWRGMRSAPGRSPVT